MYELSSRRRKYMYMYISLEIHTKQKVKSSLFDICNISKCLYSDTKTRYKDTKIKITLIAIIKYIFL